MTATSDDTPSAAPGRSGGPVPEPARGEHRQLVEQIRRHDELYYQRDAPEISDAEYDALFRRLQDLESRWPGLATEDSPTQRVGGAPVPELVSVPHRRPMLSLANSYSREEVVEWMESVTSFLSGTDEPLAFAIEPKLDGLAVELVYERGSLAQAITRGDGRTGDDVTHTAATIRGLPRQLGCQDPPDLLEVRGEVIMTHADFAAVNRAREAAGQELFVNPRNLAAGTLKLLDPREAARRPLSFVGYGLGEISDWRPATHAEAMTTLAQWGLPTAGELALRGDLDAVLAHYESLLKRREKLPFDVDGSVIKVDSVALQQRLGERSRSPRWAIAYKFPARQGRSAVRQIQVHVGRTGALTPRAVIDPVHVGGVTIEHVTLHNAQEIERLGVKPGDAVLVERAGDVIPKIVSVLEDNGGAPFVMPAACPACGTPVEDDPDEVVQRCPNPRCQGVLRRRIEHFVSRTALDVDGLGIKLVDQLVERGLVTRLSDLFALGDEQLAELPRMGELSAANVLAGLDKARTRPFDRFLFGLGVRHVGRHVAELLAARWPGVAALRGATPEQLRDLAEIGPAVAKSITSWLADADEQADLDRMLELGVAPVAPRGEPVEGPLKGRSVLFTGRLGQLSRKEAGELVKNAGGRLISGVSRQLDLLVVGEKPGSKLKKARELGVEVLDEQGFLDLVGR